MAEYRELPMVIASLKRSLQSPNWTERKIPKQYTLNSGHVTFFYNKGDYLAERYNELVAALWLRGYSVEPLLRNVSFDVFKQVRCITWKPNTRDQMINLERIMLRYAAKPDWYRFYGKPISGEQYLQQVIRCLSRSKGSTNDRRLQSPGCSARAQVGTFRLLSARDHRSSTVL